MKSSTCLVIFEPPLTATDRIMKKKVAEALQETPNLIPDIIQDTSITTPPLSFSRKFVEADLMIMCVSRETEFMILEAREGVGLPTLCLSSPKRSFERDFQSQIVKYVNNSKLERNAERLKIHISTAINLKRTKNNDDITSDNVPTFEFSPNISTKEIAIRIEEIATSIDDLRINSTYEFTLALRDLAKEIMIINNSNQNQVTVLNTIAEKAIRLLLNLYEVVGSKTTMRVVIAGAVSGILGGVGWPAVSVYALTLAAWHGQDAFRNAIDKVFSARRH